MGLYMKNLKKGVSFIVLVIFLAGTMTTLINVHSATTFQGYVKDSSGNPLSGASLLLADSTYNILGWATTNSQGYYSISVTLSGNSPYYLSAAKTRFNSQTKTVTHGGTYNFNLIGITEKIAVFFWASDAGLESVIDDYIDYLEDYEGYTKFFKFKDSSNVASSCQIVDNYEHDKDIVFVYVQGHGYWAYHSYTYFKADKGSLVRSDIFRGYMNQWEAPKKCILVESCEAGDWADDFAASPYLAIATSNENLPAYTYNHHDWPYEGMFSHYFFIRLGFGDNAVDAFDNTVPLCPGQYPKIRDYSSYVWFN